jgi:hypothetical protein
MSYLKLGIILIYFFIISDNFSFIFAQSIYELKTRSTNVRPKYMKNNNDKFSSDLNLNSKISLRFLSGIYTSGSQKVNSSTSTIIWDRVGIGQSVFKLNTSISDDTYNLENKLIEISYTFGDEFSFTLGSRLVTTGKLTITSSDSEIFNSSNVNGYGYFSVLGIEFGNFEILAGFQYSSYVYTEFDTESTTAYWSSFEDSGGLYVMGIGLAFE